MSLAVDEIRRLEHALRGRTEECHLLKTALDSATALLHAQDKSEQATDGGSAEQTISSVPAGLEEECRSLRRKISDLEKLHLRTVVSYATRVDMLKNAAHDMVDLIASTEHLAPPEEQISEESEED